MPDRIQLSRAAGWRKPTGAIVVARPGKFGNPWIPGKPGRFWLPDWPVRGGRVGCTLDRTDTVDLYRRLVTHGPDPVRAALPEHLTPDGERHVRDLLRAHATRIRASLPDLRGRDLCCWCPLDQPCHADVLLEIANG